MDNKVYVTWGQVYKLLDKIHEQVGSEIDLVAGIPRGGTLLAILYSHRYGVEYTEWPNDKYPHLLILDDIADTGKTLKICINKKRVMNGVVEFLRHALGLCAEPHPSLLTLLGGVPVIGYLINKIKSYGILFSKSRS